MATVNVKYATNAAITITLNSLASSQTAMRASTSVDNSVNLYVDALVAVVLATATGTPANDQAVYVYAYGQIDGTNYTAGVTGSDAAFTATNPPNLPLIGVVAFPAQNTTATTYGPFSVAQAFGGVLPTKWGIVVENFTGLALASASMSANYTGINATVA